jgi:hypothetical protein
MANVGSFVVNTYMNNDNFLAGVKSATVGAKKMETGIIDSFNRINEKQLKNFMTSGLKSVGVIGAIETGQQIMLATIKGMKDGSVKGLGDFGMVAAKAVTSVIEGLPVLGTFMQIGTEIGTWVAGIDQLDEAAKRASKNFDGLKFTLDSIKRGNEIGDVAIQSAADKNTQFSMSEDEISNNKVLAQMQAEYLKANQTYIKTLEDQQRLKGRDITDTQFRQNLTAQINKMEDQQRKTMQETLATLQTSQEEYNSKLAEQNDLLEWFSDMTKEIEDDEKKKNDLLKERIKFQEDSNKEALDGQNDLAKAKQAYAETEAALNAQAAGTSNVQGLSTAIGSIKVAGSTDFSIEKQMDIAKQQLNATELHTDILQEIADSLNAMGGTT